MVQAASASAQKISDLEERLAHNPEGLLFLPLAEAYRQADRLPEALQLLSDGLDRHPDHHAARVALGRVLSQSGRRQEAVGEFLQVLEVVPDNLLAARLLRELEAEGADVSPPGASTGAAVVSRAPTQDAPPPRPESAPTEDREAPEAAVPGPDEGSAAAQEPSPADELSSVTLGDLYLRQGDHQAALQIYREVSGREPGNREVAEKIAWLESRQAGPSAGPPPEAAAPLPEPDRRVVALGRFLEAARRLRSPCA